MIQGENAENITASNKVRLVVRFLKLKIDTERQVPALYSHAQKNNGEVDLPDTIVEIRNALVHSQLSKRKKVSDISRMVLMQALDVFLLYIEVSLLFILGYNGRFAHRFYASFLMKSVGHPVPWDSEYDEKVNNLLNPHAQ